MPLAETRSDNETPPGLLRLLDLMEVLERENARYAAQEVELRARLEVLRERVAFLTKLAKERR
jgi:hypothetical protein